MLACSGTELYKARRMNERGGNNGTSHCFVQPFMGKEACSNNNDIGIDISTIFTSSWWPGRVVIGMIC